MKLIGTLLACCLILAAAKAAIAVLAFALMLTLLWGLYARTARTIGYLVVCAIFWFAGAHPKWAFATTIGGVICIAIRWANHLETDEPGPSRNEIQPSDTS